MDIEMNVSTSAAAFGCVRCDVVVGYIIILVTVIALTTYRVVDRLDPADCIRRFPQLRDCEGDSATCDALDLHTSCVQRQSLFRAQHLYSGSTVHACGRTFRR